METTDLQKKAESWVQLHFEKRGNNTLVFHNYQQTASTVQSAKDILEAQEMPLERGEMICLALWFMYTGYTTNYGHFQAESLNLATSFFKKEKVHPAKQEAILHLMHFRDTEETQWEAEEHIMNDAITAYVGTKQFAALSGKC